MVRRSYQPAPQAVNGELHRRYFLTIGGVSTAISRSYLKCAAERRIFPLTVSTVPRTVCVVHYMSPSSATPAGNEIFENLRLELRRGCLSLAVLSQLRTERYGYTLRKALAAQGMDIDEGTLYPLLRRLESQGLLTSEWREEEKRNKRFYRLSPEGKQVLKQLAVEWHSINTSLNGIL